MRNNGDTIAQNVGFVHEMRRQNDGSAYNTDLGADAKRNAAYSCMLNGLTGAYTFLAY